MNRASSFPRLLGIHESSSVQALIVLGFTFLLPLKGTYFLDINCPVFILVNVLFEAEWAGTKHTGMDFETDRLLTKDRGDLICFTKADSQVRYFR